MNGRVFSVQTPPLDNEKRFLLDGQIYDKRGKYSERVNINHPICNDTGHLFKVLNQDYHMDLAKFLHTAHNQRNKSSACVNLQCI